MAPRTGIGGVTLQNVANVGRFGSQAMPRTPLATQAMDDRIRSFTRPLTVTNPAAAASMPSYTPEELDQYLFGETLSTAGERYAGYPTQSAYESAITGRAYDILSQANLAARLAAENQQRIQDEYLAGEAQRTSQYESDINRAMAPFAPPSAMDLFSGDFSQRLQEAPEMSSEILADLGRARATRDIVGPAVSEREAARGLSQIATEVDPYLQVSDPILSMSPSQLAQQIATRQFGMTPELAAGRFGPEWEAEYYNNLVSLDAAQRSYENMQQGFYSETMEETIFRLGGAEGLEQYRQDKANKALGLDPESMADEMEREQSGINAAIDSQLSGLYMGMTPETITTDVDTPVVREVMSRPEFQTAFAQLAQDFAPGGDSYIEGLTASERRSEINAAAFDMYGATVEATILADILYNWSMTG